ncbi:MAG: YafY family transcriptional regulator [Anaerolineae bacterium]|nr:YafY family transcriptional regulator [Anaerolineae bacterium]
MYNPGTRLLTVLELLQSHGELTGPELATRLEVEVRSVRRYITMLRDMGIPVDSEPGRYGYYHLRRGFRLPPLMFNNDEILVIILGLMAVRRLGLTATAGVESATSKIERVLPDELRERARAVQCVLTLNIPTYEGATSEQVAKFSLAAYQDRQMWIEYHGGNKSPNQRTIDVYGLVYHAGFWYIVGYCHLREDLRIFRLDRVGQSRLLDTTFTPPPHFDALQYVLDSIAGLPGAWSIEVLLRTTLDEARTRVSADVALLEAVDQGVMMRSWADGLDWMARYLVGLNLPLTVIKPPELRDALQQLAGRIMQMAAAS